MPYDARIATSLQSASLHHRQRSRRRIAAVSFLSNISLDGTHHDTNLHQVSNKSFIKSNVDNNSSTVQKPITKKDICIDTISDEDRSRKLSTTESVRAPVDLGSNRHEMIIEEDTQSCDSNHSNAGESILTIKIEERPDSTINEKRYNPNIYSNFESIFNNVTSSMPKPKKSSVSQKFEKFSPVKNSVIRQIQSAKTSLTKSTIGNSNCSITEKKYSLSIENKENVNMCEKERKRRGHHSVTSLDSDTHAASKDRYTVRWRKHSHTTASPIHTADKHFSSSESLGVPSSCASRVRKVSSTFSESGSSCTSAVSKDGKLLRAGGHHGSLGGGNSIASSDGTVSRKRTVSGSRHLPTIADAPGSTIDLSGHHTPPSASAHKLQEISYSNLLVSSPYFNSGKQRNVFDQVSDRIKSNIQPLLKSASQHPAVGRCFSHDPNIQPHQHPIDPLRHSHPQVHTATICQSASYTGGNLSSVTSVLFPSYIYAPELLDDPELRAGKHRKVLRFPSYMTTVIEYAKPDELKKEINENFKKKFPHVKITLSKLRSLKREMVHICYHAFPSMASDARSATLTVAIGHAYFDSLCLNGKVEKSSRKLLAGACLMISAKLNDVKGEDLETLVEKIETLFRVERSELVSSEMTALLSLQFNVHLPMSHVNTHYQRLLFEH